MAICLGIGFLRILCSCPNYYLTALRNQFQFISRDCFISPFHLRAEVFPKNCKQIELSRIGKQCIVKTLHRKILHSQENRTLPTPTSRSLLSHGGLSTCRDTAANLLRFALSPHIRAIATCKNDCMKQLLRPRKKSSFGSLQMNHVHCIFVIL